MKLENISVVEEHISHSEEEKTANTCSLSNDENSTDLLRSQPRMVRFVKRLSHNAQQKYMLIPLLMNNFYTSYGHMHVVKRVYSDNFYSTLHHYLIAVFS